MAVFIAGLVAALLLALPASAQSAQELAREGFLAKDRRQYPIAIQLFSRALAGEGLSSEQRGLLLYSRGVSREALGQRDLALLDLDAAIALLPNYANSFIYRALIWADRREFDRAREDLLQALRLKPDSAVAHNNLGSVYEYKGEIDLALESYGRAVELDPSYDQAFYNRAHAYIAIQDYRAAIADYDKAIAIQPDFADAFSNRGGVRLMLGDIELAIKDFNQSIKLQKREPMFWSNRANAFVALGRIDEAMADFDHAQQIDPGNPAIYLGRGRALLFSNAVDKAIEDFQTAGRLRPTNPNPAIWLYIAQVHQGTADREELRRSVKKVDPGQWPSVVLELYLGTADADRVRELADRGKPADILGRRCEADFYIGEFLIHQGKPDGRQLLEAVLARCPIASPSFLAARAELKR